VRLIHYSQIGDINISKISGLVQLAEQRVEAFSGQTNFLLTILEGGTRIVKTEFEVNGIPYEETTDEVDGEFSRSHFTFEWNKVASEGGFDMEDGMVVTMRAYYYTESSDVPQNTVVKEIIPSERLINVIGSPTDMDSYFEIYDLSNIEVDGLLGVNINSAFYSHPNLISYNSSSKELTISGIVIDENDHMAVVINTI